MNKIYAQITFVHRFCTPGEDFAPPDSNFASIERISLFMHDAALIKTCQAFSILNSICVINIFPLCRSWLEGSNQLMA